MKLKPPVEKIAYTRAEAIEASGLTAQTLDHYIAHGELRAIKSGRRLIIFKDDLLAFMRSYRERGAIPSPISQADKERLAELNRARRGQ